MAGRVSSARRARECGIQRDRECTRGCAGGSPQRAPRELSRVEGDRNERHDSAAANAFVNGESLPGSIWRGAKGERGPTRGTYSIARAVIRIGDVADALEGRVECHRTGANLCHRGHRARRSASDPIYSKSDSEVTPPRQVYPALPAELPTTVMKRALTVVDLVIAPDGLVERVHLRTPPRDIHEFMLLSAAKAWRFEPALLDGRPVRFRHSVALTSFE